MKCLGWCATATAATTTAVYATHALESTTAGFTLPPPPRHGNRGVSEAQAASVLQTVHDEHQLEWSSGVATFERVLNAEVEPVVPDTTTEWNDDDFVSYSVGRGHAGPDECSMTNGDCIFQTVAPVLTDAECDALILEAQRVIDEGLDVSNDAISSNTATATTNATAPSNAQLGEARVSELPVARAWLRHVLHQRLFPLLASRFGIDASDWTLHDGLVIGYGHGSASGMSRSQPVHRDASFVSLNVALSPRSAYHGGGTFFEALSPHVDAVWTTVAPTDAIPAAAHSTLYTDRGHVTCHAGGILHAGRGVTTADENAVPSQRWILVLFCIAKDQVQVARRCHALGLRHKDDGRDDDARATFLTGLQHAPHDHLLQTSLGGMYMAQANDQSTPDNRWASVSARARARQCLARAAASYPHCTKAHMALGRMFLADGKPRAALRRFHAVLTWLDDRDLGVLCWDPYRAVGWDARLYGAQAALWCAQTASRTPWRHGDFPWRDEVETALTRIRIALQSAPDEERLLSMLDFAHALLDRSVDEPAAAQEEKQ